MSGFIKKFLWIPTVKQRTRGIQGMNRIRLLGVVFTLFLQAGCRPAMETAGGIAGDSAEASSSRTIASPGALTLTTTRLPENPQTQVPRPSETPSVTATPGAPAMTGTPIPILSEPLEPGNVDRIIELARWQTGELLM